MRRAYSAVFQIGSWQLQRRRIPGKIKLRRPQQASARKSTDVENDFTDDLAALDDFMGYGNVVER